MYRILKISLFLGLQKVRERQSYSSYCSHFIFKCTELQIEFQGSPPYFKYETTEVVHIIACLIYLYGIKQNFFGQKISMNGLHTFTKLSAHITHSKKLEMNSLPPDMYRLYRSLTHWNHFMNFNSRP